MKKIAFLAPSFPKLTETFIRTEIQAMQQQGHDVCVLTFAHYPHDELGYPVYKIQAPPNGWRLLISLLAKIPQLKFQSLINALVFVMQQKSLPKLSLLYYSSKIALKLSQLNIQHVHAHFAQHSCAHAITTAKLLNIPCSFVAHGHDIYNAPFDLALKLQHSDLTIAVCQDMQRDLQQIYNGNIKLLHCGVDTALFSPPAPQNGSQNSATDNVKNKVSAKTLRLIFVGRLIEQKGLIYLIQALKLLPNKLSVTLDIVGDGELLNVIEGLTSDVNNVTLHGAKDNAWLVKNLCSFDALIAPFCQASSGAMDTGPIVLKEAMAMTLAVITTDLMGCKEIVTKETGFIVPQKDSIALAHAIEALYDMPFEQRQQLGLRARQHIQTNFNAQTQAQQLSQLIRSL